MRTIALQKPVLNPIAAFDATEDKEYTFVVSGGGDLWSGVLITIEDNTNPSNPNIEVFTLTQTTTAVIPANTLVNNHQYQATIKTTTSSTKEGMTSANSSKSSVSVQFYCYTQPTFEFTNIVSDGIITSSMYAFNISYTQIEGEYLSTYRVILYDIYDVALKDSGWIDAPEQTISSGVVSCNIVYSIEGFNDGDQYRIEVYGITMGDTEIKTDIIPFSVDYERMRQYSDLYAINHCEDGNIAVGSDINVVKGKAYKEPVTFHPSTEAGTEADLRNNGVVWTNVIDSNNFSVFLQFRAPVQDLPHLILTSFDGVISETTFTINNVEDDIVFNNIVANTTLYDDNGGIVDIFDTIYDISDQELENINYTINSTIYGFMLRRASGVVSTELTMLHEPIEALTNHYTYTTSGGTIDVEVTEDREVIINDGFTAVDDGEGNITLTATTDIGIIDMSNNGNIIIGNYEDNGWLTGLYLTNDNTAIPIRFKLGSETEPKDVGDLEDGDTYLWAFTEDDSIDLKPNNFEIIGDILYYYPNGKGD